MKGGDANDSGGCDVDAELKFSVSPAERVGKQGRIWRALHVSVAIVKFALQSPAFVWRRRRL